MSFSVKLLVSLFACFSLTAIILPILIWFLRKEKIKQVILHYVDMHSYKSGTPTMGGIAFVLSICICGLIFCNGESTLSLMTIIVTFSYGLIGFLDDFIKFKFKRNLGLKPYQKIISQLAIAVAVAVFVYKSEGLVGSVLYVPFVNTYVDFGVFIIPFVILIFIACTNSVNLTDGLDGLAGTTTLSFLFTFALLMIVMLFSRFGGINEFIMNEYQNIVTLCFIGMGALLAFLLFNGYPAKIFMGDTGSLALGGMVASVAIFTRNSLFIPIIGFMFVLSSVSVIIQVLHYKRTHKRVFLMAPLHHHFEKRGIHEVKIVVWYSIITLLLGLICVLFELI